MKNFSAAILCGVIAILAISCNKEKDVPVTSVSLSQSTAEMIIGETVQLSATVLPSDATDKSVTWASSKQSVATINASGLVTAIAEGVSTITASAGGKSATCMINVSKRVIPVASVDLNKTSMTLVKGSTEALTATVKPDDATDKTVTWSSSNPAIASVDSDGRVTGVAGGEVTIYAKAGEKEAKCVVTVTVPVESISINKDVLTLSIGDSETLTVTITPEGATDKKVSWTSSDAQIATVSEDGKVVGVNGGTATITARVADKEAKCVVTVTVPVASISLNKEALSLMVGTTETLVATITPNDATDKTISWSSSDSHVATVDNNGKVSAVSGGSAVISAKSGDKEAKCVVTVTIPVSSVTLNKASMTLVEGESETLVATVAPADATDKTLKWSSSNEQVAMVGDDGKVTAVKAGEATITVKAGDKSANCQVKVEPPYIPVSGISLNKSELELKKGSTETLVATVSPSNATEPEVTWKTSNIAIARVDQNGNVTAVNTGTATITAKAGGFSATCTVSVVIPVTGVTLNTTSLTMAKGTSSVLTAKVYPTDATNKAVSWSSSNTGVATVTDGTVVAVGGGVAEIRVRTQDGGYEASCTVTVQIPVTGISLNTNSISIYRYDEETLYATVYPNDATNKAVSWSSDTPGVASVDTNGKVTGVSGGSATITVKTADGGFSAKCYVTVTDDGHQAVDLGLSVKWATTNYGTTSTTATGGYYMWGDPYGTATAADFSAPNVDSISGTGYDIVRKNWGGSWRIPSRSELAELYTKCSWKQTAVSGVSVFRVTGPNGNSIIVPFTGLGYPASGPAGTKQYISMDRAYLMSGNSYSDQYGRFAYVYYYGQDGKYNWESYNADFIYITIRPVR